MPKATFVWGRPQLVLPKGQDAAAETKLARLDAVLADPEATLLAQDECDMMLLPVLRATWHRRGEQPKVLTPGKNQKRPIFGSVNLRTGAGHYQLTGHKRAVDFIASLEHLLLAYSAGLISVLVDNASIHTAKVVHKWLADHQRLQLVYLPAYASHKYNPTEKIWWYLKDKVLANRGFKLLVELDHAIRRNLEALTPSHVLTLINSPVTRQARAALAI